METLTTSRLVTCEEFKDIAYRERAKMAKALVILFHCYLTFDSSKQQFSKTSGTLRFSKNPEGVLLVSLIRSGYTKGFTPYPATYKDQQVDWRFFLTMSRLGIVSAYGNPA
jgi:hypothetical protein